VRKKHPEQETGSPTAVGLLMREGQQLKKIHTCAYTHTHTHTQIHKHRCTHRGTHRHTNTGTHTTQKHKHRDPHTQIHTERDTHTEHKHGSWAKRYLKPHSLIAGAQSMPSLLL
jgi:hypothetical protein